uniref:Uncharacterized protein n=1 Tax=Salix viminalis TaxID=40686 RepID=A0A6N2KH71_SALVM
MLTLLFQLDATPQIYRRTKHRHHRATAVLTGDFNGVHGPGWQFMLWLVMLIDRDPVMIIKASSEIIDIAELQERKTPENSEPR